MVSLAQRVLTLQEDKHHNWAKFFFAVRQQPGCRPPGGSNRQTPEKQGDRAKFVVVPTIVSHL